MMNDDTCSSLPNEEPDIPIEPSSYGTPPPPPPPLQSARAALRAERERTHGIFARFGDNFGPLEKGRGPFKVIEALLKRPATVAHEITNRNPFLISAVLLIIIAVSMAGYGLIMGTFAGGEQLWAVPVKVLMGQLLSALICLPSLYIFMCLSGGEQSFAQVWGLFLSALALSAILLVGFAPISWIFSQSTNAISFMGGLHLVFWVIGTCFALQLLEAAFTFLNRRRIGVLKIWSVIFVLVVVQMCTTLRPLVGNFQGYKLEGKQFFLAHWMQTANKTVATPTSD
jgi:hypothetical protein